MFLASHLFVVDWGQKQVNVWVWRPTNHAVVGERPLAQNLDFDWQKVTARRSMFFPFVEWFGSCLSPPSDTDNGLRAALRPVCQEGLPRAGEGWRHSQLDKVGPLVRRHLQVKLFVDRSLSFLLGGSGLRVGCVPQAVEPFYKRRGKILYQFALQA